VKKLVVAYILAAMGAIEGPRIESLSCVFGCSELSGHQVSLACHDVALAAHYFSLANEGPTLEPSYDYQESSKDGDPPIGRRFCILLACSLLYYELGLRGRLLVSRGRRWRGRGLQALGTTGRATSRSTTSACGERTGA
jgi:hypothetical protein